MFSLLCRRQFSISYSKSGIIRCSPTTLYSVISQTQNYHRFIPWVDSSKIVKRISDLENYTELTISFNRFKELSYTSHVCMEDNSKPEGSSKGKWVVRSLCQDEPLKKLESVWQIEEDGPKTSKVDYFLDFEFNSPVYQLASSVLKDSMGSQLWTIFEKQALSEQNKIDRQQRHAKTNSQ